MMVHDHSESWVSSALEGAANGAQPVKPAGLAAAASVQTNKRLVSALNMAHVPAFGFCGFEGNLVQLRCKGGRSDRTADVVAVKAFWLDVITEKGGVPVIANVGCGPDGVWTTLDSDQLAIRCALAWDADLLIFLVEKEGVRDRDGVVMRWVDSGNVGQIDRNSLSASMTAKLNGCHEALAGGVRRVRIYPSSRIDSLPDFYFKRIDYGTEVTTTTSQDIYLR